MDIGLQEGGAKKRLIGVKKIKNKICKKLFLPWRFYTLYEQKFSNLIPLSPITFPKEFRNSKSLHIGLQEVGAKKALKGVRNTNTKQILLSKAKFAPKQKKIVR